VHAVADLGDNLTKAAGKLREGPRGCVTERLFDAELVRARRTKTAVAAAEGADLLLRWAADELAFRVAGVKRVFPDALMLGSHGSPCPALALSAMDNVGRIVRADSIFVPYAARPGPAQRGAMPSGTARQPDIAEPDKARPDVVIDDEALPFAEASFDLVVSPLQLHTLDDVPGLFAQIRRTLRPDGLFLAVAPAAETLAELRASLAAAEAEFSGGASPRVAPFASLQSLAGLLQRAGFALPVADVDRLTLRYDDMFALVRDLRAMGETNALAARSRRPPPRRLFERAAAIYHERFSDPDGRIRATFELASLSGWAPHASQPAPLRPGSAKSRLADALGAVEHPLPRDPDPGTPR
jgi:SAM-dependent methyltransferase